MFNMIFTVLSRFVESYGSIVMQTSKDWFFLYRLAFIPASILVYCATFLVIMTVLAIIIFITTPLSYTVKPIYEK